MKLNETIEMMCSEDFKERFRAEYYQLKIRINGLSNMLDKYKKGELNFTPSCSYELLDMQRGYMLRYAMALEERAKVEGIDLTM